MQDRIRDHIRSNVWGLVAVFIALSGTAYATHPGGENTISSGDIINGAVRTADIRNGAVNSAKVVDDSLTGKDVANNSLTASELATNSVGSSELGPNSVNSTKVVNDSLLGFDIAHNSVTGTEIDESTLSVEAMGCQIGVIHGFARIMRASSIPPQFTSSSRHIDRAYNCAGGEILVRRPREGLYSVWFTGNPSTLPFATSTPGDQDNFVTVHRRPGCDSGGGTDPAGVYCVIVRDNDGDLQDGPFQVLLP
jgi:hypothetical protein